MGKEFGITSHEMHNLPFSEIVWDLVITISSPIFQAYMMYGIVIYLVKKKMK